VVSVSQAGKTLILGSPPVCTPAGARKTAQSITGTKAGHALQKLNGILLIYAVDKLPCIVSRADTA